MDVVSKSMRVWYRIVVVAILVTCANLLSVADSPAEDSFGSLAPGDRERLVKMAVCANAAYSSEALPPGYRAMTRGEWNNLSVGCPGVDYSDDGYISIFNGLRGRLMVHVASGRSVVAWSGCDSFTKNELEGLKDLMVGVKHVLAGSVSSQYEQALAVCRSLFRRNGDKGVWVVGHSLGGGIVAYIALALDNCPDGVEFATFNGLGLSPSIVSSFGLPGRVRCARRLVNVYCSKDPIYNFFPDSAMPVSKSERLVTEVKRLLTEMLEMPKPEHPGRSFSVKYRIIDGDGANVGSDAPEAIVEKLMPWTYYHGIRELIHQMEMLSPSRLAWHVWACGGAGILVVAVLLVWLIAVKISNKNQEGER